ncbi:hypothetical protein [Gibbsiella quercinecans]|uniref:hypothetical protein n=1 Tax=Gibbsiella quercinecans TaxID=929813 RepID=UPI00242F0B8C|nr:hypothetical protein [Gibbsiella quercinecans]
MMMKVIKCEKRAVFRESAAPWQAPPSGVPLNDNDSHLHCNHPAAMVNENHYHLQQNQEKSHQPADAQGAQGARQVQGHGID